MPSYDAMGNMTCRNVDTTTAHSCGSAQTGATMTYDTQGCLASWTAPNGTSANEQFLYDTKGNRVLQRTVEVLHTRVEAPLERKESRKGCYSVLMNK